MSVILLVLGIVMALAGIATAGFGIPINEFTLGTTLIIAGTTALTGGLILIGLSAVVSELARVAEGLKARPTATRPTPRPAEPEPAAAAAPVLPAEPAATGRSLHEVIPTPTPPPSRRPEPAVRPPEPYPAPPAAVPGPSAVEVSASAIERLRSSIPRTERPRAEPSVEVEEVPLSPNGAVQQAPRRAVETPPSEPRVNAEERAAGTATEALKASRLDFLFRSKPARPAAQPQGENFDALWPTDARQARPAPAEAAPPPLPLPRAEQIERQPTAPVQPALERRPEPAPAEEPRTAAILKSGVVDGMAYTLYADGSIEAKLPHGTVRFGSIAELRAHIENNS